MNCEGGPGTKIETGSTVQIGNSSFTGCYNYEGGGLWSTDSVVNVSDTVFANNDASWGGGANVDNGSFDNCIFYNNTGYASAGLQTYGDVTVANSVFINNNPWGIGGSATVTDSIFSLSWGMAACEGAIIERSLFAGSSVRSVENSTIRDSVFAGLGYWCGYAGVEEFACGLSSGISPIVENVTLGDGIIYADEGCSPIVRGAIAWPEGIGAGADVMYSLAGSAYAGEGNLSTDPLFVGFPASTGLWSDVYWDEGLFQTELTDETASWAPGDLAGSFVDLDPGSYMDRMAVIADNTETTIWAWGNTMAYTEPGNSYEILDLHLQPGSPAIDAGYGLGASAFDVEGKARWDDPDAGNAYDCGADTDCVEYADMGAYERQP